MHVIKSGARGEEVTALQTKLGKLGFTLKADGIFGPDTKLAIEELQAMFGYDVDGQAGDATNKLIDQQVGYGFRADQPDGVKRALESQGKKTDQGALAGAELTHALKQGSEGPFVSYLQRRLRALGLQVNVDGKFGSGTAQAVKQLQQSFGYDVDGIVGPATNKLINAQIGYGWNIQTAKPKPQA